MNNMQNYPTKKVVGSSEVLFKKNSVTNKQILNIRY